MAEKELWNSDNNKQQKTSKNKDRSPEARIKMSPLSLSIFKNETENGTFRSIKLQRTYTEDDGQNFKHTDSLRPRDLRKASRLFEKCADELE